MEIYDPNSIVDRRYNKLTILRHHHDEYRVRHNSIVLKHYVLCQCECGNQVVIDYQMVKSGKTKSCGCAYTDYCNQREALPHDSWKSALYHVWHNMKKRCTDPSDKDYHKYGARGITICEEWYPSDGNYRLGYANFYNWAFSTGYVEPSKDTPRKDRLTLDRIDNDGPYAPWNCRWTSYITQANNRRNTKYITDFDGKEISGAEFARKYGLPYKTVKALLSKGRFVDEIRYMALFPNKGIHHRTNGELIDREGFRVMLPSAEVQQMLYQLKERHHGK